MKKSLHLLTFLLPISLYAQVNVDIQPYSFVADVPAGSVHHIVLDEPDMVQVALQDKAEELDKGRYRFAVSHLVGFDLNNSGTWTTLSNGDRLWRLKITSTNAKATMMAFDQFFMPVGARMHIYSEDKSEMIGAFTSYNNHESGMFATDHIYGSTCIIEYYEPVQVSGQGVIHIFEIGHAYRSVEKQEPQEEERDAMASDPCEVNVKCPEGNNWWQQRTGAVRIRIKDGTNYYWCSGSVVNNTAQDCTPYVLSAWHCGIGASVADRNLWIFYFNYQRSACATGTSSTSQSMTGCTVPTHSNDGGGSSGSDYMLCLLNNPITATYGVFYNGFDASGTGSTGGTSIHHPAGDVKKISTYTGNLVSSQWNGNGLQSHWRVNWVATVSGHGVTEGGSSGSPIFNSAGVIVGTLTGGSSFCTSPTAPDYYGKMSYHWNLNANPSGGHLDQYLDPGNTGTKVIGGKWGCTNLGQEEFELEVLVSVYPNPASDFIYVESSNINTTSLLISMYDELGKLVYSTTVAANHKIEPISVKNLESGMYVLHINDGERSFSKKILVER